jgi:integrase
MIPRAEHDAPITIPVPWLRPQTRESLPFDSTDRITLRLFYERCMLPDDAESLSPRTLAEYRCALNRWEELTFDPDMREISDNTIRQLRDGLQQVRGQQPPTINKTWRHIKCILNYGCERRVLPDVPQLGRKKKSRLLKESPKQQRETLTTAEVASLVGACRFATYPARQHAPAPKLWSVALYLFYMYGARTFDVLRKLSWNEVRFTDRLLQFEALKTSKLQGLPLTDLGLRLLRSIRGPSQRVFPGFNTTGHQRGDGRWKKGYYTTWRSEITAGAELLAPVQLRNLRESAVTRWNDIKTDLGDWIAAHYMPGVNAQHYDYPTREIRDAVESFAVPPEIVEALERYQ